MSILYAGAARRRFLQPGQAPSLSVSASGDSVVQGEVLVIPVSLVRGNNSERVTVSVSGLPVGAVPAWDTVAAQGAGDDYRELTLAIDSATAEGSYSVTITATGTITGVHTTVITLGIIEDGATYTSIFAETWRFDGVSGDVLVSSGFPMRPGQLTDANLAEMRVYVGGSEKAVALQPLRGKHPDGSYRSCGIQFLHNLTNNTPVSAEVRLNAGTRGTTDRTWVEPIFASDDYTIPAMTHCAVIQPISAAHRCASGVALTLLQPQSDDVGNTVIFGTGAGGELKAWSDQLHGVSNNSFNSDRFNNGLVLHAPTTAGDTTFQVRNDTGASVNPLSNGAFIFNATPGVIGTRPRYQDNGSAGGVLANGATRTITLSSGSFGESYEAGAVVYRIGSSVAQSTYGHTSAELTAWVRSGTRVHFERGYLRGLDALVGDIRYLVPGSAETDAYSKITAIDTSLAQPNTANGGRPAEWHSGNYTDMAMLYWLTGWKQPWRYISYMASAEWGTYVYTLFPERLVGSMRLGLQLRAQGLIIAYLMEATMRVDGGYSSGRKQGTESFFAVQLPYIIDTLEDFIYTGYTDPRSGVSGFADGIVGQRQTAPTCGHSAGDPGYPHAGHFPYFMLFTVVRTLMLYYNFVEPDSRIPTWLKTMAELLIAAAHVHTGGKYADWPYCLEAPGTWTGTTTYWAGFHAELFGFMYAHETDPTDKARYLTFLNLALEPDQYDTFTRNLKGYGEYFAGHLQCALYYRDGGAVRGIAGVHPTAIVEPPLHTS